MSNIKETGTPKGLFKKNREIKVDLRANCEARRKKNEGTKSTVCFFFQSGLDGDDEKKREILRQGNRIEALNVTVTRKIFEQILNRGTFQNFLLSLIRSLLGYWWTLQLSNMGAYFD